MIFALCLILSFYELQNTPFLILDEIDSALDKENLKIFMSILEKISQKSQIFFTSFNEEILEMQDLLILSVEF